MVTTSPDRRRLRRLTIIGLLGVAVLTGGAGAAYASNANSRAIETGYAVVVDGGEPAAGSSTADTKDCPEDAGEAAGIAVRVEAGGQQ